MQLRNEISDNYKWQTEHLYKTRELFFEDVELVKANADKFMEFSGKLNKKDVLLNALKMKYDSVRRLMKIASYADRNKDVDMSVAEFQELSGIAENVATIFASKTSFMEPELLEINETILDDFKNDKDFADFDRYFEELLRSKKHTLSKKEEAIMARFSALTYAEYETYSTFSASDMPFNKVTLSNGEEVEVNIPTYSKYRQSDNRDDRKKVFDAFWKSYDSFKHSIAKMLHYQIKHYETTAKIRKFNNSLEKAMYGNELPNDFFDNLKNNIRDTLPVLHDYLAFKKDYLNIPDQGYHDVYASMVKSENAKKYSYEDSVIVILESLAKMPQEYKETIAKAMKPENGWVDIYPSKGKRSGAYMSGEAYDTHPYVLLNHIDDYNSASTLAHEMGHAMHSYFSNKYQPFEKSKYTIFVAEVASIFNEIMLINHLINTTSDKEEKKFLVNHYLEMIRSTVFRQMQFAEFEDNMYKKVESGEMLTPEFLNETYGQTLKDYYGEDKGLMKIDSLYTVEWAFIPHFYYNYYVYQYVVGFIAALTLATKVLNGDISSEQYVDNFLKAGDSKPPIEILKSAGVDLTTKEPYELTAKVFKDLLNQMKEMLVK